jgi:hypothetical protein
LHDHVGQRRRTDAAGANDKGDGLDDDVEDAEEIAV